VAVDVAPHSIDWNRFKRDIADEVKAATGRDLTISGTLDLALLPTPHLKADGVRLSNLAGAAVLDMARVKSLRIDVRFWPLLSGRIEAATVRLVEPVIELERLTDGRVNWDLAPAQRSSESPADIEFAIDRLVIVDGTAIYRDAAAKQIERADQVNAEISAASLAGPFRVNGKLAALGVPASIDARIGALGSDRPIPVSLRIGISTLTFEFGGTLSDAQTKPRLEGKVKGTSENLARALSDLALPKGLARPVLLAADLKATQESAVLDSIDLELGDLRARGKAKIAFDAVPRIEGNLAVNRLVLAPWLEPQGRARPGDAGEFVLPSNIAAKLDLAVQLLEADGGPYRDLKLSAALAKGEVQLSDAALRTPGGGTVSLNGTLLARRGQPYFDGALEAKFDHLRGFLEALKVDVADVSADRLLKASLAAKAKSDGDKVEILDIDGKLDSHNLRGGIVMQLGPRLGIGATIDAERLDLDAYLAPKNSSGLTKRTSGGAGSFDANVRARIASLGVGGTEAHGFAFDGTLQGGTITVREASVREIFGAAVKLSGTITKIDTGTPSFAIERLEARHGMNRFTGSGRLDLGGPRPKLTARLGVGDLVLDFQGSASGARWPRDTFDLSALDALDADLVIEGNTATHAHWKVEQPRVSLTLKDRAVELTEFSGRLFDGTFRLSGTLAPGEVPEWRTKLLVDRANLVAAFFGTGQNAIDLVAGNISLDADLRASGQSAWDLVSSSSGAARVWVRDGVMKGFDLPSMSRRLASVNDPFDLLGLESALAGGQSNIEALEGNFEIADGVIRAKDRDLVMLAPAGEGVITGGADVANWTMYSALEFRFVDIPDAPIVLVTFTGPLDAPVPTVYSDNLKDWVIRKGFGQSTRTPAPLPAKPTPPPPAAKPAAPAPVIDGKDLTRGLLDGLRP
jgi:uncharacterized protein involved in outer membrane biogenesis